MTDETAGEGDSPADSPPEPDVCIADEGREGLEALHEVVEIRRAQRHLGRVALPQNLPTRQNTVTRQARTTARIQVSRHSPSSLVPCRVSLFCCTSPRSEELIAGVLKRLKWYRNGTGWQPHHVEAGIEVVLRFGAREDEGQVEGVQDDGGEIHVPLALGDARGLQSIGLVGGGAKISLMLGAPPDILTQAACVGDMKLYGTEISLRRTCEKCKTGLSSAILQGTQLIRTGHLSTPLSLRECDTVCSIGA